MKEKSNVLNGFRLLHRDEKGMGTTSVLLLCGVLLLVWAIFSLVMGGISGHMANKREINRARAEAERKASMPQKPVDRKARGYQVKF